MTLQNSVAESSRRWDDFSEAGANAIEDEYRRMVRNKTWRTKCVLTQLDVKKDFALTAWISLPLSKFQREVQRLDERGNLLADLMSERLSPLKRCEDELADMIFLPVHETKLRPVFYHFTPDNESEDACNLVDRARTMILSMRGQLFWRLRKYRSWPFPLAKSTKPSFAEGPGDVFDELYAARWCCIDYYFGAKARRLWPTAAAMRNDPEFRSLLKLWVKKAKQCNMHVERLLALIKASAKFLQTNQRPSVERLVASGFLAKCKQLHCAKGGKFSACMTCDEAIAKGANLQKKPRQVGKPRGCSGGYFLFQKTEKDRLDDEYGAPVGRQAYRDQLRAIAETWRTLSDAQRQAFKADAELQRLSKDIESDSDNGPNDADRYAAANPLLGISSAAELVTENAFERAIRKELGLDDDAELPSFKVYSEILRNKFTSDLLVLDDDAIPADNRFHKILNCEDAHPGCCVTNDVEGWHKARG